MFDDSQIQALEIFVDYVLGKNNELWIFLTMHTVISLYFRIQNYIFTKFFCSFLISFFFFTSPIMRAFKCSSQIQKAFFQGISVTTCLVVFLHPIYPLLHSFKEALFTLDEYKLPFKFGHTQSHIFLLVFSLHSS